MKCMFQKPDFFMLWVLCLRELDRKGFKNLINDGAVMAVGKNWQIS